MNKYFTTFSLQLSTYYDPYIHTYISSAFSICINPVVHTHRLRVLLAWPFLRPLQLGRGNQPTRTPLIIWFRQLLIHLLYMSQPFKHLFLYLYYSIFFNKNSLSLFSSRDEKIYGASCVIAPEAIFEQKCMQLMCCWLYILGKFE